MHKVVKNISWLLFDKLIRMVGGLFVGIWVARYLGPDLFGKLNYAIAFIGLFGSFSAFGLQAIVVRELVKNQYSKKELLSSAFLIQAIGALTAYIFCNLLVLFLREDDHVVRILVAILSCILLFRSTDFIKYYFEANVESKYIVWVENSVFVVGSIARIFLILTKTDVYSFAILMIFEALLLAALLLYLYGKKVGSLIWPYFYTSSFFMLIKNSWPLMLSSVTVMIYMRIDQIMLGEMADDSAVGVYSAAIRISEIWYVIPTIVCASLFPSLVTHHQSDKTFFNKSLQSQYELMVYLAILIAIPLSILSDQIIEILYGSAYSDASQVLIVHIWTGVFVFLGVASQQWFIAEHLEKQALLRTTAGMIVNVGLNFLLIPKYQALGAAWATLIAQAIAALFFDLFSRSTWPMFRMKMKALFFWRLFHV
jgi:O-antigen/teichoic acid export membrane protein